jgi:cytidylate kinase
MMFVPYLFALYHDGRRESTAFLFHVCAGAGADSFLYSLRRSEGVIRLIIAIDGPAAAGKGTLARKIAAAFGFAYLDTGALYRAVGLSLVRAGKDPANAQDAELASVTLDLALLDDPELRSEATGGAASKVAAIPGVRANLLDFQRNFASQPPEGELGAVLDGRDIGTVVCPDADLKLFVTASAEVRAERRRAEMEGRGEKADFDAILADVRARDERDMNRKDAPLKPAEDALLLDTSNLDIDAVFLRAAALVKERLSLQ